MNSRDPFPPGRGGFSNPFAGPVPRDLMLLLGVVFVTFSLQFFASTALIPALLRLTPAVWRNGFIWQLVTYPFVGFGGPSLWFLLELLIAYMFGRSVFERLGRSGFWRLLTVVSAIGGAVAVLVAILGGGAAAGAAFSLIQGQRMLIVILVAAFATLYRSATILLFFVFPVRAGWFIGLEIVFGFMGFLGSRDLAGFIGLCAAVGATWLLLSSGSAGEELRRLTLRARARWMRFRLDRLRRKRGIRLVEDDERSPGDRWMH